LEFHDKRLFSSEKTKIMGLEFWRYV